MSYLRHAIRSNDFGILRTIFGQDPGEDPLALAAELGNLEMFRFLVERGFDPRRPSAMIGACSRGNLDIVRYMFEHGAEYPDLDPDDPETDGASLLQKVLEIPPESPHKLDLAMLLIQHGASARESNVDGQSIMHLAAIAGREDIIRYLFDHHDDLNLHMDIDHEGHSALHLAAMHGHTTIVQLLVDRGSDIFAQSESGMSALDLAVLKEREDVIDYLLDRILLVPENVNRLSRALLFSALTANERVFHRLVDARTPVGMIEGAHPLHIAGTPSIAERLIDLGTRVDVATTEHFVQCEVAGLQPLHTLVHLDTPNAQNHRKAVETVEVLIQHGANVNARVPGTEETPLFFAARRASVKMTNLLLYSRADASAKNTQGETPLVIAAILGRGEVVEALIDYGVDVGETGSPDPGVQEMLDAERERVASSFLVSQIGLFATQSDDATPVLREIARRVNADLGMTSEGLTLDMLNHIFQTPAKWRKAQEQRVAVARILADMAHESLAVEYLSGLRAVMSARVGGRWWDDYVAAVFRRRATDDEIASDVAEMMRQSP
jgi:ankyrin repeat protein